MIKILKIITLLFITIILLSQGTPAETLSPYIDEVNKFQFSYPSDWKINKNEPNYKVQILNKDETAIFGVMIYELKKKADPKVFIEETEKFLNVKNELDEKDTRLSQEMLKFMKADDS